MTRSLFEDPAHPVDQWSPKLVGERLVEAVRWARYSGGRVGPAGIGSGLPMMILTEEERIAEFGLPDGPDEEEEEKAARHRLRIQATPAQVSAYERALEWPTIYLVPDHQDSARVLGIWVRCKVYNMPFAEAVDRRKWLSRAMAYRYRDRALSIISVGLDKAGVPL